MSPDYFALHIKPLLHQTSTREQRIEWLKANSDLWEGIPAYDSFQPDQAVEDIAEAMKEAGLYSPSYTPNWWTVVRMIREIKKQMLYEIFTSLG